MLLRQASQSPDSCLTPDDCTIMHQVIRYSDDSDEVLEKGLTSNHAFSCIIICLTEVIMKTPLGADTSRGGCVKAT